MPHALELRLTAAWPPTEWQDVTVVLAVSGGADSVAMLRAIAALKTAGQGRVIVAHANHRLRGEESDADEALVVELAERLGLACQVGQIPIEQAGQGIESLARRARYAFLQETAARLGARYVVTAHTADDQAETVLHRIVRGTGLRGLGGMARSRRLGPVTLLRPLLAIRRAELLAYLADLRQPYRTDSSNLDLRFTRNRIRHRLLPQMAETFGKGTVPFSSDENRDSPQPSGNIVDTLVRLGTLAGEAQSVIDQLVDELAATCVSRPTAGVVEIDCAQLRIALAQGTVPFSSDDNRDSPRRPRYLVRELLMAVWRERGWPMQAMGFDEWDLLADMAMLAGQADHLPCKRTLPGSVTVEAEEGKLRVSR